MSNGIESLNDQSLCHLRPRPAIGQSPQNISFQFTQNDSFHLKCCQHAAVEELLCGEFACEGVHAGKFDEIWHEVFEIWEKGEPGHEDIKKVDGSGEFESQFEHIHNPDLYLKIFLSLERQTQESKKHLSRQLLAHCPHLVKLHYSFFTLMARKRQPTIIYTDRSALGS